jgi:hypothetical protein
VNDPAAFHPGFPSFHRYGIADVKRLTPWCAHHKTREKISSLSKGSAEHALPACDKDIYRFIHLLSRHGLKFCGSIPASVGQVRDPRDERCGLKYGHGMRNGFLIRKGLSHQLTWLAMGKRRRAHDNRMSILGEAFEARGQDVDHTVIYRLIPHLVPLRAT